MDKLEKMIADARKQKISEQVLKDQRISFAFGSANSGEDFVARATVTSSLVEGAVKAFETVAEKPQKKKRKKKR